MQKEAVPNLARDYSLLPLDLNFLYLILQLAPSLRKVFHFISVLSMHITNVFPRFGKIRNPNLAFLGKFRVLSITVFEKVNCASGMV